MSCTEVLNMVISKSSYYCMGAWPLGSLNMVKLHLPFQHVCVSSSVSFGCFSQRWTSWSYCHMLLCKKAFVWERGLFTCWRLAPCHSTQLWISLRWWLADLILGTDALPFPHCWLSATFHIQYHTNTKRLSPHLPLLPLDSSCFLNFLSPTAQNVAWSISQKKSESACCLIFLCHSPMWEEVTEREKVIKTWGAEGSHRHTQYKGSKH